SAVHRLVQPVVNADVGGVDLLRIDGVDGESHYLEVELVRWDQPDSEELPGRAAVVAAVDAHGGADVEHARMGRVDGDGMDIEAVDGARGLPVLAAVAAAKEPDLGAGIDRVGMGRIDGEGVDHRVADPEARRPPRRAAVVAPLHAAAGAKASACTVAPSGGPIGLQAPTAAAKGCHAATLSRPSRTAAIAPPRWNRGCTWSCRGGRAHLLISLLLVRRPAVGLRARDSGRSP